jgi:toxin YoeB
MTAAERRARAHDRVRTVLPGERECIVRATFRQDLGFWIGSNPRTALRILRLIDEVMRDPHAGLGKPEPLKHDFAGQWSRRITERDRLIYLITDAAIVFILAREHYPR